MAGPHGEEQRQADVALEQAAGVDGAFEDQVFVLQHDDERAHAERDDRPERVPLRAERQILDAATLCDVRLAELEVAPRDTAPRDEPRETGGSDEPAIGVGREQAQPVAAERDEGRQQQRRHRYGTAVGLEQEAGRHTLLRHRVEHAGRDVETGRAGRQDGGENDRVHDARRTDHADLLEDQRERRRLDVAVSGIDEARVGVRQQEADDDERADVEDEDAEEHGADGLRDRLLGLVGLTGGDTDHLGALEAESGDHEDGDDAREPADERRLAGGPVLRAGRLRHDAEDHEDADGEEHEDGDDLDRGEQELALAEGANTDRVDGEQDGEEDERDETLVDVRRPVVDDGARRRDLRRDRDRPVEPVVPALREAEAAADESGAVRLERVGERQIRRHLAEALHEQPHHEPDDAVRDERAAGARLVDRTGGGEEQARPDGAADGDHVEVARIEVASQLVLTTRARRRVGDGARGP